LIHNSKIWEAVKKELDSEEIFSGGKVMYYTDYSTAKINHDHKTREFAKAAQADRAARWSVGSSPSLNGRAKDKIGEGLIGLGTLLKGGHSSGQADPCS
jgi:hypothetical protein